MQIGNMWNLPVVFIQACQMKVSIQPEVSDLKSFPFKIVQWTSTCVGLSEVQWGSVGGVGL